MRRGNFDALQVDKLLKERDRRLNDKVCGECRVGVMELHQELHDWVKCSICGYCKEIKNDAVRIGLPVNR